METRIKCSEDGHEREYVYVCDKGIKWLIVAPCPGCEKDKKALRDRISKQSIEIAELKYGH